MRKSMMYIVKNTLNYSALWQATVLWEKPMVWEISPTEAKWP